MMSFYIRIAHDGLKENLWLNYAVMHSDTHTKLPSHLWSLNWRFIIQLLLWNVKESLQWNDDVCVELVMLSHLPKLKCSNFTPAQFFGNLLLRDIWSFRSFKWQNIGMLLLYESKVHHTAIVFSRWWVWKSKNTQTNDKFEVSILFEKCEMFHLRLLWNLNYMSGIIVTALTSTTCNELGNW